MKHLKVKLPTLVKLLSAAVIFSSFSISSAAAQGMACAPRDKMIEKLSKKYSEARTAGGLVNPSSILEVWTSSKTGSWTIIVTRTTGKSCILAAGKNWLQDDPLDIALGDPA